MQQTETQCSCTTEELMSRANTLALWQLATCKIDTQSKSQTFRLPIAGFVADLAIGAALCALFVAMKVVQQACSLRANATVVPVVRGQNKSQSSHIRVCGSASRGHRVITSAATLKKSLASITYTSEMLVGKSYVPPIFLPTTFARLVAHSTGESFRAVAVVDQLDMLTPGEGEVRSQHRTPQKLLQIHNCFTLATCPIKAALAALRTD